MRKLGKTNLIVKEVGCGGIPIQRLTKAEVSKLIESLIVNGVNFIDTARGYTNSEELLGSALIGKRKNFILASKSMKRDYEGMYQDVLQSLKNLKTSYIDLYQLHNVKENENYSGALKALRQLKKEGRIKHIGVSSHSLDFLESIIDKDIFETIQYPYNIIEDQASMLFMKAKKNNIGVIAMKPLAGGNITDGKRAIQYILNNENIDIAIPGMENPSQVLENISGINTKLSDEDLEYIKNIKEKFNQDFCRRCGYCLPCSVGIDIPSMFLFLGYYDNYNLQTWAKSRYDSMEVKPSKCISCGECEKRCPYQLKIIQKLKVVQERLENNEKN